MSVSSEPADFTALYTQHLDFVWRNLRALGVSVADLDDAAQDTFVVAYRRRADFDSAASMRAWLYGIARRVAWRQRRGGGRRQRLEDAVAAQPLSQRSLEEDADEREALRLVQEFLAGLPEPQREVYWLSELEGMTAAQVGAAMGISPNTVSSRLRTARAAFIRYTQVLQAREEGAARRLTRAGRRQANPTPTQRRRVASALAVQFGATPLLAGASGAAFTGAEFWLLTSAAAVAVGVLGVGVGRAAAPEAGMPVVPPQRSAASAAASVPTAPLSPPDPAAAVVAPVPPEAPPVLAEPRGAVRSRSRSTPARAVRSTASADSISAEAELVRAMQTQLARDPKATLRLATEHAQRFPKGVMQLEAAALRVQSLCALDREAEAKSAAAGLGEAHPWGSVAAQGCAVPGA